MNLSQDMIDLITLMKQHSIRFALVGGYAVNHYGYVRMTQDIDFLLLPSVENNKRMKQCLAAFGFGDTGLPEDFFEHEGSVLHLGVEPNRIDLMTHMHEVSSKQIFNNLKIIEIKEGLEIPIISLSDLIEVKNKSQRLRDQADAEELRKINNITDDS